MPVLLFILGALGAAAVWYWRVKNAREGAEHVLDMANDVRLAARRFGFRAKTNVHPARAIEDPRLAGAGVVVALAELEGPLSADQIRILTTEAQTRFNLLLGEAEEIVTFGRWIAGQCGTKDEAVRRLGKRVADLAGPSALPDLEKMIEAVAPAPRSERGEDALAGLRRILSS